MTGVYFLYYRKRLRYIGSSINLERRIRQHKGAVRFDWYSFVIVPKEQMLIKEREFIGEYKPPLNQQHTPKYLRKIYKMRSIVPDERRKKISNSIKKWYDDPENKAFFMSRRKNRISKRQNNEPQT